MRGPAYISSRFTPSCHTPAHPSNGLTKEGMLPGAGPPARPRHPQPNPPTSRARGPGRDLAFMFGSLEVCTSEPWAKSSTSSPSCFLFLPPPSSVPLPSHPCPSELALLISLFPSSLSCCLSSSLSPAPPSPPHPVQGRGGQVICSSQSGCLCRSTSGSLGRSGKPGRLSRTCSPAPLPPLPSSSHPPPVPPPSITLLPSRASIFSSLLCVSVQGPSW